MMFYESKLKMLPGVHLPVRSVLLQLTKGTVLISPIHFSQDQIQSIRELTPVTDIIAPNLHHNKFLGEAHLKFPGSKIWAPMGFKQKYSQKTELTVVDRTLGEDFWPFHGELEMLVLEGAPTMNEAVFFHVASKTLIVTDLVFQILRPSGLISSLVFRKFGTYKRFAMSKFWLKFVKDKGAFERSLEKVFQWDFESVLMAHGTPLLATSDKAPGVSHQMPQDPQTTGANLPAKARLLASLQERGFLRN